MQYSREACKGYIAAAHACVRSLVLVLQAQSKYGLVEAGQQMRLQQLDGGEQGSPGEGQSSWCLDRCDFNVRTSCSSVGSSHLPAYSMPQEKSASAVDLGLLEKACITDQHQHDDHVQSKP